MLWEKPKGGYFHSFFDRNMDNIYKRTCKSWKHLVNQSINFIYTRIYRVALKGNIFKPTKFNN